MLSQRAAEVKPRRNAEPGECALQQGNVRRGIAEGDADFAKGSAVALPGENAARDFVGLAFERGRADDCGVRPAGSAGQEATVPTEFQCEAVDVFGCRMVGDGERDIAGVGESSEEFLLDRTEVEEAIEPDARRLCVCGGSPDPVSAQREATLAGGVTDRAPELFEGPGMRAQFAD